MHPPESTPHYNLHFDFNDLADIESKVIARYGGGMEEVSQQDPAAAFRVIKAVAAWKGQDLSDLPAGSQLDAEVTVLANRCSRARNRHNTRPYKLYTLHINVPEDLPQ